MALEGKIAVVTGAAMGIGKATTEVLLKNGAKVALLDINESAGKSFLEEIKKQHGQDKALFVVCDVQSEEQIKAALQKTVDTFGGIDILVNNAGILNEIMWEKCISINVTGTVRMTYLALEHMNKLKGGRGGIIVNMSSMAGLGPLISSPVYTATKHAVVGFTRSLAAASDALGYGVRINTLCPACVQTDLLTDMGVLGVFSPLAVEFDEAQEKMGFLKTPEVADRLFELITDETKNGEALVIFEGGKQFVTFPSIGE